MFFKKKVRKPVGGHKLSLPKKQEAISVKEGEVRKEPKRSKKESIKENSPIENKELQKEETV